MNQINSPLTITTLDQCQLLLVCLLLTLSIFSTEIRALTKPTFSYSNSKLETDMSVNISHQYEHLIRIGG